MAQCNFSIDFTGPSETLIGKASSAITGAGGTFRGDSEGGDFSVSTPLGKIAGAYTISSQTIGFTITDKPFLLSCGMIEDQLRKYIM
jgi:hypothetical protein